MTSVDTLYTPEVDMLNNAKYYWKVIATDTDSLLTESKTLAFILGDLSCIELKVICSYQRSVSYPMLPQPIQPIYSDSVPYQLNSDNPWEVFNSVGHLVTGMFLNGQR